MRRVHAPRWAALHRALIARDDAIGTAALATALLLVAMMAIRIALAWHAGLL